MRLIDTHTHLYSDDFSGDRKEMIQRALDAGISRLYMPGIDSTCIDDMLLLEQQYPGVCIPMMGLHPCYVKENYKEELQIVKDWLDKRPFTAIGEIGMDFYWDTTFADQQLEAFNLQMQWALDKNLPIIIHTRNAMQPTIDAVKPFAAKGLTGIFHCFSGSYESAVQIINMGFYLGIGGVITYKNAGLPAVLEKIDLAHMVLETDAPYLTPVPFRGKRNESAYMVHVAEKLADTKQVSIETVAKITSENALKIFRD
ncbi:TatD DNase family protein [Filimonas lacunae]|uniref:TatD DNase family protein n=1 Tax=Filimonas lacunae TaxID=477680 RepID=A0A173MRM2_9BACT|nr:TatD family hydrolase [Filimonas lacunae]BAV10303.1 deoxyribonuclease YcfH [Filimonas lacunae]SIT17300.1 TatD DNase family protein [Filimonas lacunae]